MVKIIGHRGASADWPENTLAAFRGAFTQGADWVELDVRSTIDSHLVVLHDPTLPDGRIIAEMAAAEVPPEVPTLADALRACVPMGVNVEIKHEPDGPGFWDDRRITDLTVAATADTPVPLLISSFDLAVIDRWRQLAPQVDTAYLVLDPRAPVDAIRRCVVNGHAALHPWDPCVDRDLIDAAHEEGIAVNVWTVDDPDRIAELAGWGVDGIVTNVPAVARRVLRG